MTQKERGGETGCVLLSLRSGFGERARGRLPEGLFMAVSGECWSSGRDRYQLETMASSKRTTVPRRAIVEARRSVDAAGPRQWRRSMATRQRRLAIPAGICWIL